MTEKTTLFEGDQTLHCPTCQAVLKRRRSRNPDACEMVCGGCGEIFDVCDSVTRARLKPAEAQPPGR